jgi:hypothetical protein
MHYLRQQLPLCRILATNLHATIGWETKSFETIQHSEVP